MDEKDRAGTIVNITASLIKQRLDEFMRSTQGLPTDLRIEAMESVASHVMKYQKYAVRSPAAEG